MGANSTQARGISLFLVAFVLICAGLTSGGSIILLAAGLALLVFSFTVFLKCKPWEHQED